MLLRLAKPYGGDTYGIHFPLIQGTEVAVAFHEETRTDRISPTRCMTRGTRTT